MPPAESGPRRCWRWTGAPLHGSGASEPAELAEEERAEIERLRAREDELTNLDEEDWTEELVEEAERIETRLGEIAAAVEGRAMFRRADFAIAGCIATIDRDGSLRVIKGLVKPEDVPEETASSEKGVARDAYGSGENSASVQIDAPRIAGPTLAPSDPKATAREEAGVGIGLADDLRAIRAALIKARLAEDFEAAFDLLLFQLARAVFGQGYRAAALDIAIRETADRPTMRMNDEGFADWSPGEAMLADRSRLPFEWMEKEDDGEAFAGLRALPQAEKQALFAAAVARTVKGQLAFEPHACPELDATAARLDIDFAAPVRPTAEMLWSRIRKDRILAIARETLGASWASARGKLKKADLAQAMEPALASGDAPPAGVTAAGHAAALAWTPPGFAPFDKGRMDEEAEAEPSPASGPNSGAGEQAERNGEDGPRPISVVESMDSPALAERLAAARAAHASCSGGERTPAGASQLKNAEEPEVANCEVVPAGPSDSGIAADDDEGADPREAEDGASPDSPGFDAMRITIADGGRGIRVSHENVLPPQSGNGRDTSGALDIPEFLRRA